MIRRRTPSLAIALTLAFIWFTPTTHPVLANHGVNSPQEPNTHKRNTRPGETAAPDASTEATPKRNDGSKYSYEFSQPDFHIRHVVIEHDATGKGKMTFERRNEESATEEFQLSEAALKRILGLYETLRFLDSQEEYQSDKQFPHLGTMKIGSEQGNRKRVVEFNWTRDPNAAALATEYRRLTDQLVFVFDMSVARANQPLNAPKLLQGLESLLRRQGLSDPRQLLPLLEEIGTDEHLPLIARNHASRLIKKINGK
ncbi:MAG TPA: hypothetical protein VJ023_13745 [Pyrinomonadaceae bacterium]|nr:hypothetical protein [Pyrinomonadaceae bacterium]